MSCVFRNLTRDCHSKLHYWFLLAWCCSIDPLHFCFTRVVAGISCLKALLGDRVWDLSPRSQLAKKQRLLAKAEREAAAKADRDKDMNMTMNTTNTHTHTDLPQSALTTSTSLPSLTVQIPGQSSAAHTHAHAHAQNASVKTDRDRERDSTELVARPLVRVSDSPPRARKSYRERDHEADDKVCSLLCAPLCVVLCSVLCCRLHTCAHTHTYTVWNGSVDGRAQPRRSTTQKMYLCFACTFVLP